MLSTHFRGKPPRNRVESIPNETIAVNVSASNLGTTVDAFEVDMEMFDYIYFCRELGEDLVEPEFMHTLLWIPSANPSGGGESNASCITFTTTSDEVSVQTDMMSV